MYIVQSRMTISSTLFLQQDNVSALLGVRSWTLHHQLFPKAIQLSWPKQKIYFQTINVSPTFLIQNVHISVTTDDFHLQLFHNLVSPHFHHNKLDPDILEISSQLQQHSIQYQLYGFCQKGMIFILIMIELTCSQGLKLR